jgi:hypothetical protein
MTDLISRENDPAVPLCTHSRRRETVTNDSRTIPSDPCSQGPVALLAGKAQNKGKNPRPVVVSDVQRAACGQKSRDEGR